MQTQPKIPSAPRAISSTAQRLLFDLRATRLVWLIVGILWATLGWIVPGLFARGLFSDLLLSISSEQVSGEVLLVKESDGLPVNRIYPQAISYKYSHEGQTFQSTSTTFDTKFAETLRPKTLPVDNASLTKSSTFSLAPEFAEVPAGNKVMIEVSGLAPSISRVAGTKRSQYGLLGSFTMAFPLFGLVLCSFVLGRRRRERQAYVSGDATWAQRISTQEQEKQICLRWEFEINGRLYFNELILPSAPELAPLLQAPLLPIVYRREDPQDNILYLS
jgi:hypothetical protein